MHPVMYYTGIFIVIAGIGMAVANTKVEPPIRKQRWLKFGMYILITSGVLASFFYNFFPWLAWVIAGIGLIELAKVNTKSSPGTGRMILSFLVYLTIATGFILFAKTFTYLFLVFIYFQVLIFDGFCQVTGQLFGKHPLVPGISPTKTWEGLIGGWIFCLIAAVLAAPWISLNTPAALIFGFVTGLSSFYGDLLASWYKRKLNIKDYSSWLPGQGGFLDRFDSFLVTGAAYYLVYIVIFKDRFSIYINP
jgi:phosphatidate cytidylyltransferase